MPIVITKKSPLLANGDATKKSDEGSEVKSRKSSKGSSKSSFDHLGEDKADRLQTLVVTWDDAEIADYFYK